MGVPYMGVGWLVFKSKSTHFNCLSQQYQLEWHFFDTKCVGCFPTQTKTQHKKHHFVAHQRGGGSKMQGGRCGRESKPPNPGVTNNVYRSSLVPSVVFFPKSGFWGDKSATLKFLQVWRKKPSQLLWKTRKTLRGLECRGTKLDISPSHFEGFLGSGNVRGPSSP